MSKIIGNFVKDVVYNCLVPFAKKTTVQGISLIVVPRLHFLERLLWALIIAASGGCAIALTISNWNRYNANPTVVSIEKDYRNWRNVLPSATGCFVNRIDPDTISAFIFKTWGVNSLDEKYNYYLNFTKVVSNVSYHTLKEFAPYENDVKLNKINLLELAAKVHPKLAGTLVTFDTKRKTYWKLIMTELGICFVVNNKFSNVFTFKIKGVKVSKPNVDETLLKCHYLNGLCYARYDSDPTLPLNFYVHSHLDILHATMEPRLHLGESIELEINYLMEETISDATLRQLSPSQRKCRFDDEPLYSDIPFYSTSMCYITCRYRLAMKLCGCKPFFYHYLGGKVCNISGLLCLSRYAERITKPPAEIGCQCPQPCDLTIYLPLIPKITLWKSGYFDQRITFRWGIIHPTTKYKRDIIFGFEDLVVSIGGILALFLGVSFISFVEIVFFTSEYLIGLCFNRRRYKKLKPMVKVENNKQHLKKVPIQIKNKRNVLSLNALH